MMVSNRNLLFHAPINRCHVRYFSGGMYLVPGIPQLFHTEAHHHPNIQNEAPCVPFKCRQAFLKTNSRCAECDGNIYLHEWLLNLWFSCREIFDSHGANG